jgi:hypothetical protein
MSYKSKKRSKTTQSPISTDSSFERSIGTLTSAVQKLTDKMSETPSGGNSSSGGSSRKPSKAQQDFDDQMGGMGKKMFKGIESVFGKKASKGIKDKMVEGFSGKAGGAGKSLLGGGLKGAGGGMAGLAGGAMKALGPIGAVASALETVWTSFRDGSVAKWTAQFGAMFNVDNLGDVKQAFKDSEAYNKIITDYNYVLPLKLQQQAARDSMDYEKSLETDALSYSQSLVKDKYEYEIGLTRDSISFSQDQAKQSLDANLARNKTLFTNSMGYMGKSIGISERALQAIGSSTQAVLDAVKNVGVSLGTSLKNQVSMATSAAGLGAMYGSSADDVLTMSKSFRLMDKSSAEQAINMTAGLKSYARMNDMSPAQLFKEMADSQQEIFKYTNYTSQEFAQQVVLLKNMNTSMTSMMKASDSMVLNYKDSIKAEMSLSSMLGQNVDLSETRARLMSGDMAGGAAAMKSALGGMDINAMNPFAKQQLSEATGMGIDELMNLMSGKGGDAKGSLEEKQAAKTGAAIAEGALKQDIGNAAAKLALEQKQRAQLLVFEQLQRKGMLVLEQEQRLQNLAMEQKWRLRYGKLESEQEIDMAVKKIQAEARATSFTALNDEMANTMQDLTKTGKISGVDASSFKTKMSSEQAAVTKLLQSNKLSEKDMQGLAKYQADMVKYQYNMTQTGVKLDPKDLPTLAKYIGGEQVYKKKMGESNQMIAKDKLTSAKTEQKEGKIGFMGYLATGFKDLLPTLLTAGIMPAMPKATMSAMVTNDKLEKSVQLATAEAKKADEQLKAINADTKKVDELKKQNTTDSGWLYKQNNTLIGILSESLIVARETALQGEKPINLDGKKVDKQLLNRRETQYGLGPRK